jgi:hypothetical protein
MALPSPHVLGTDPNFGVIDTSLDGATSHSTSQLTIPGDLQNQQSADIKELYANSVQYLAENAASHSGLDYAYKAGIVNVNGAPTTVAAGTITLTDDATNYVFANTSGVVAKNTTGFIAGCLPMATVVTASGAISTVTDKRTCGAAGSAGGGASASADLTDLAEDSGSHSGLNYGYKAGRVFFSLNDTGMVAFGASTVLLTDNAWNYVEAAAGGSVQAVNGGPFTIGNFPIAKVQTASGAITSVVDCRGFAHALGVQSCMTPGTYTAASVTVTQAGLITAIADGRGLVPVGAVVAFLKSLTNCPALPDAYVECNGQTLSDGDSVFNGVVIPDLNGCCCADNFRFLRGNAASGSTCGLDAAPDHQHSLVGAQYTAASYGTDFNALNDLSGSLTYEGGGHDNKPLYYDVVWVLRVK